MALDWLLDPVCVDQPCGPDLEKADDPQFLDYYFEAEARLPERYYTPGAANAQGGTEDRLFDPRSVNLQAEAESIHALLRRSRDLRLLSLLARFQILAGRLGDFAATLEGICALLGTYMADLHPRIDGSAADRRGALDALTGQSTVVMALLHLPVISNPVINARLYQVATGAAQSRPIDGEDLPDPAILLGALQMPAVRAQVDATHADLLRADAALRRIRQLCKANGADAFTPDFAPVLDAIGVVSGMIAKARPDLVASPPPPDPVDPPVVSAAMAAPPADPAHAITTRAQVRATLDGCQRYLATHEPSSMSLLLVTQARALVGVSIVEAMDLLLPQYVAQAQLTLGKDPGFTIDIERMRNLSQSAGLPDRNDDGPCDNPVKVPDRAELASHLRAIEEFYQRQEPASPIPALISAARDMLTRTFHSIVSEILPPNATAQR